VLILSNSTIRVRAEGLSKWYFSGKQTRSSLKDLIQDQWNKMLDREWTALGNEGPFPGTFWALKDVSFEIKKGEVLGLIGPNGAGKSTLVRILSRLTDPSSGIAVIEGKSASVLEVGSGFHPELSVAENALLNGVFLGMRRSEVENRLGRIVEFSELKENLNTPVKKLSHGMQYRLAVSVALHSDADFLLMDEVLEVTDKAFEEKCLAHIQEGQKEGKSYLFVSHNLSQLEKFSSNVLWIESGQTRMLGKTAEILGVYLQ